MNIIVGIGFGKSSTRGPLDISEQAAFLIETRRAISESDGEIHAENFGTTTSDGWGQEPGVWIAGALEQYALTGLKAELRTIADKYGQDSIALTVGTTEFV